MTKHALHRCNEDNCFVCDGGLGLCTVCGGAEASLPTECPQQRMSGEVQDAVQAGEFDFIHGRWLNKSPALDLSQLPPGVDWLVGRTNGGLTVHAKVGTLEECFAETPQKAFDAAVQNWKMHNSETGDGLLV